METRKAKCEYCGTTAETLFFNQQDCQSQQMFNNRQKILADHDREIAREAWNEAKQNKLIKVISVYGSNIANFDPEGVQTCYTKEQDFDAFWEGRGK